MITISAKNTKNISNNNIPKKRNPKNKVSILLGKNIVYFRQLNNLSQDDLATSLKTDKSYLSEVENAKRKATTEFIYRITQVFEIEPEELFKSRDFNQLKNRVDSRK